MSIPVLNPEGLPSGDASFTGRVAEQEIKPHLIHETVVSELGHRRAGTHKTKNRGEVRGGGKKPWRQKGTGRARQGSTRAPHWRGGGVTFGPTPRSYGGKVNRKVRAQAFRAALRAHADRGSLAVMDPTGWDSPSTKRAADYLFQAPDGLAPRPLLVLVDDPDGVEGLSFRNLSEVYVLAASDIEVVDLMAARCLLVERAVWERFTGGELSVTEVAVEAKVAPERTEPPKPTPITRKKKDDAPKRGRKKASEESVAEPDEAVEEPLVESTDDSPEAEVAAPEKPKRTRKKAEPLADEDAPTEDAVASDDAPEAEVAAPEKPKRTRKKAEPDADEDAPAEDEPVAEEKPKRARKKAEPAADEDAPAEDGAE